MTLIMFFIFLIGLTDVYIAGKFGKEAQAAYGLVFQLYFVFSIIASALTVGSVSLLSRLFASGERQEFGAALKTTLIISVFFGSVLGGLAVIFSKGIIDILHIPEPLKEFAVPITKIYATGLLFNYILLTTNGILRATKMIRQSLVTMCVVCVLNVWLNFLLSLHTPLGFRGVALATVISTCIGSLINSVYIRTLGASAAKFSLMTAKRLVSISWPAGVLQVVWQLGTAALFLILSSLPEHAIEIMAAFTNGLRIESAIFLPAFAFNMANAVVVGNLLGKGKQEDAFHGGILTACIGVAIVSILTIVVMLNAKMVASFLSNNETVVSECTRYIYISLISEPFMAWGVILSGGLNGAGDTRSVMSIIALSMWLVRIPLSYMLAIYLHAGAAFVWWAMNLSILVQTVFISRRYFNKQWIARADTRKLWYNKNISIKDNYDR
jgi:putative MATE family efflux protein